MSSDQRAKRPLSDGESSSSTKRNRQECRFGMKCYRKNPKHFEEYHHTHLSDIVLKWKNESCLPPDVDPELKRISAIVLDQLKIVRNLDQKRIPQNENTKPGPSSSAPDPLPTPQNVSDSRTKRDSGNEGTGSNSSKAANASKMAEMMQEATKHHGDVQAKLDAAAPYYYFLTSIAASPQTHSENLSITFTELLDKGLGELESSLQINFMVELGWLLAQYFYTGNRFKPLTLLYGVENEDLQEGMKLPSNITAVKVKPPTAFGHHHTKMAVLAYKDNSIRVIVSTANLVESDWENRTQGLWISPKLPQMSHDADTSSGESPTEFKTDLLRYLSAYRLPQLQEWLSRIRKADFSSVRVFFVASIPGTHYGPDLNLWGHRRVRSLLAAHVPKQEDSLCPWNKWPVIGQFSSIGTLGVDANSWVGGELLESLSQPSTPMSRPPIKLIYPSFDDVSASHDGLLGGACLPYQRKVHNKQPWLTEFLYRWKSNGRFRSQAMPHIKSYTRVSPCQSYLAYFLLTSGNLSKAAWGCETKNQLQRGLRILSYEAGVIFLPKFIVEDDVFDLEGSSKNSAQGPCGTGNRQNYPAFPLHYDLPLLPYKSNDSPWFYDVFQDA